MHYQAGHDRRWFLDRGSSATYQVLRLRSAYQRLINRRFKIAPPALPERSHVGTLARQATIIHACYLKWRT